MSYRDLVVYQRSVRLAQELRECVRSWDSFDRWTVGAQLVRAAGSVGANLAEAAGRWGIQDQRRIYYIARGSAYETEHWLQLAVASGARTPERAEQRASEIARMLSGLIRALPKEID